MSAMLHQNDQGFTIWYHENYDNMLRRRRNRKIDILLHLISFVCGDTSSAIFESSGRYIFYMYASADQIP